MIKKFITENMSEKNKIKYLKFAKFLCNYGIKPPLSGNEYVITNSWANPLNHHKPEIYLKIDDNVINLFKTVLPYLNKNNRILEIGCNCGRSLSYLYGLGFKNLSGIEINKKAVNLFKKEFVDTYNNSNIIVGDATKELINLSNKSKQFDLIFTLGVLVNIRNNDILRYMCKLSNKFIVTSETEESIHGFPRDFKKFFHKYNFEEISFDWYTTNDNNNVIHPQKINYKNYLDRVVTRVFVLRGESTCKY